MRYTFVFIFFLFFGKISSAQFNVKVGYQYAYAQADVHNQIIDQFNVQNGFLNEFSEFEKLSAMHGVVLGVRQRWDAVALNLEFVPLFQLREFKGIDPADGTEIFRKHFYRVASYSAGLEFFIKNISFGGSLDFNTFRSRSEQYDRNDRYIMYSDNAFGSHFFIGINVYGNEKLSIALQPYVRLPLSSFDLTEFDTELGTNSNLDSYEEKMMIYGFRLIFNNGIVN